jgi:hypothetical protein
MAHAVECLPSKHEAVSSNTSNTHTHTPYMGHKTEVQHLSVEVKALQQCFSNLNIHTNNLRILLMQTLNL